MLGIRKGSTPAAGEGAQDIVKQWMMRNSLTREGIEPHEVVSEPNKHAATAIYGSGLTRKAAGRAYWMCLSRKRETAQGTLGELAEILAPAPAAIFRQRTIGALLGAEILAELCNKGLLQKELVRSELETNHLCQMLKAVRVFDAAMEARSAMRSS